MKDYTQLTRLQRYQIYALRKEGLSQTRSTISRELRRNTGGRGYRPKQADMLAQGRSTRRCSSKINQATWHLVEFLLRQEWSPEQITGWFKRTGRPTVSHEWIYQYILKDKRTGGKLYTHLSCKRKRKKRYGSHERRGRTLIKSAFVRDQQ